MNRWLSFGIALIVALLPLAAGDAAAQGATWVRGYPQRGASGCVEYVAQ